MTMACQTCGRATEVADTFSHQNTTNWRAKHSHNAGVVRIRRCADGHEMKTIEIDWRAWRLLVDTPVAPA
ncbi:hypothetical protein [Caulobacter phage KcrB]|nr:hypothetical protein [Caulobacter phage KcrB]WCD56277.1 hypothetical protein [Caulobacter phage RLK]WNV48069.1 hypothetical protein GB2A_gp037 [Caulobacter phage GB2A]